MFFFFKITGTLPSNINSMRKLRIYYFLRLPGLSNGNGLQVLALKNYMFFSISYIYT